MPGIADSNVQALAPVNSASQVAEFSVTLGVGDLMSSFRNGFITVDDLTKRSADKPLENAQRRQALADTNIVRPKQREVVSKELDLKNRAVDLQAQVQPQVAEATVADAELLVGNAKKSLEDFQQGGDPKAFTDAWRQFFPGRPLPREGGKIDYGSGAEDLEVEVDRRRKLEASKAGVANISENKIKRVNPQTKQEEEVLVRTDKVTGRPLGETVLSSQAASLTEQQAGAARYSARLRFHQDILKKNEEAGFDATALTTTARKYLPNRLQGEQLQIYTASKNNWIAANLRKESGAAIAMKEYKDADMQYFPQDGDSRVLVASKQALRELAEEEMTETIGPSAPDRTGSAAPAASPAAPSQPVPVNSPAEAPATAQFIKSPDGRVFRNPKYVVSPVQ